MHTENRYLNKRSYEEEKDVVCYINKLLDKIFQNCVTENIKQKVVSWYI